MTGRQIDMHELQLRELQEEMREEKRGAPPASARRAQHFTVSGSSAAPPPRRSYGFASDGVPRGVSQLSARHEPINIHELLKAEALSAPGDDGDRNGLQNRPGPHDVFGVKDQYIILDSFYKDGTSRVHQGEFKWNFMVQGATSDSVIGVRDTVDTVTQIQVMQFAMPVLPEVDYVLADPPTVSGTNQLILVQNNANAPGLAPTLVLTTQYPTTSLLTGATSASPWVHNPYSQTPYNGHFSIQIQEAGNQAFSDRYGARHHFDMIIAPFSNANPNMLVARPLSGRKSDTFTFTDPIQSLHGITLTFRNPDVPIRFLQDTLYQVQFSSLATYVVAASLGHDLAMGDRIYIELFNSGNVTLDNYMNRLSGHAVAGDPTLPALPPGTPLSVMFGSGTFWMDPAISITDLTPPPVFPLTATVRIAKRRLRIPIRMRCIVPRLTNYIAPSG